MSTRTWILLAIAAFCVAAFISYMRRQMRKSREIEKTIDYSKIRKWEDDD